MNFLLKYTFLIVLLVTTCFYSFGQIDLSFQEPPSSIKSLALAETSPNITISPNGTTILLLKRNPYVSIQELAETEYRLAGVRFNPNNYSPSRMSGYSEITIQLIGNNRTFQVQGLPKDGKYGNFAWSKNNRHVAFTNTNLNETELWLLDIQSNVATKWSQDNLNLVIGNAFSWLNDSTLVYQAVVPTLEKAPTPQQVPNGPMVQESSGKKAAARSYQDLLKSAIDDQIFTYYATSQIKKIQVGQNQGIPLNKPSLIANFTPSPDGNLLLIRTIEKPFSYQLPWSGFPHNMVVWDAISGNTIKTIAQNPNTEETPLGFDDAVDFPRNFGWRPDQAQTIYFVKALDGGLYKNKVAFRDEIWEVSGSGKDLPRPILKTKMRFQSVVWGEGEAWITQSTYNTRQQLITLWQEKTNTVDSIQQRSSNDAYSDIGTPLTSQNQFGLNVLAKLSDGSLILRSQGSSPKGDFPFIQSFNPSTKTFRKIWQCQAPYYEYVVRVIDFQKGLFITSRESQEEAPNFWLRNWVRRIAPIPITNFQNPYPELSKVFKEKIRYKRGDGVELTGNLYLPENFKIGKDKPLPLLIWAYPREYKSASDAAQIRGSAFMFTRLNWGSPIYWVTQGYAILDNAEMPIVGEGKSEPNDHFIPQLYLNAHAAIQHLAKQGIADSNRVAVGGHSYGAFMTANLLAHTKLFKAGIARSGAYNRTLTPFGFQSEQRTYWEAQEIYHQMSPFTYAKQLTAPILFIHGELDNNSGTFPIQSERMFAAIKGLGGNSRYVVLPFESHSYAAKENILHMLWEQHQWLEKHVKNAKP